MSRSLYITTNDKMFMKYTLLADMKVVVTTKSPIRIGGTPVRQSPLESDLPTIKNADGIPIIPGSSLKGFFKANLIRILGNVGISEENHLNPLFGGTNDGETASALLFQDLTTREGKFKLEERTHIRIDPELGSVKHGSFFTVEAVMDCSEFEGTLLKARNVHPSMFGLLHAVIKLANDEIFKIGGLKSRGYGTIQFDVKEIRFKIPGKPLELLSSGDGALVEPLIGFDGYTSETIRVSRENGDSATVSFSSFPHPLTATATKSIEVLGSEMAFIGDQAVKFLEAASQSLQDVFR